MVNYVETSAESTLARRDRELIILRTAARCKDDYIWAAHSRGASLRNGLSEVEVRRVLLGPDAEGWTSSEAALLRAVDELLADHFISAQTWSVLGKSYDDRALLDVMALTSTYTTLANILNSSGTPLEDGWVGLGK